MDVNCVKLVIRRGETEDFAEKGPITGEMQCDVKHQIGEILSHQIAFNGHVDVFLSRLPIALRAQADKLFEDIEAYIQQNVKL